MATNVHRRMKKTFLCDESMVITIPIGSLKDVREGQLMPDKFHCVFKDSYKVFVLRGKPKPLGAAQAITALFIITLGVIGKQYKPDNVYADDQLYYPALIPSILFVVSGILSFAAGTVPNMHVTKLSFALNIICVFWSVVSVVLFAILCSIHHSDRSKVRDGIVGLILCLLVIEKIMAIFLIYWLSKAVCREHFNTLPFILLKQGD